MFSSPSLFFCSSRNVKFSFTIFCFYNALANAVYNHRAKSEGTKDGVGIFDWQMGKTSQADLLIVTERLDC